jgi:hypothetical protein
MGVVNPVSTSLDPRLVVWIPPEHLDRARGEYREHLGDVEINGKVHSQHGGLVQWVDHNPGDELDGSGHFERYHGDEQDYVPRKGQAVRAPKVIEKAPEKKRWWRRG